ncbi:DUF3772 domain-containing protein [Marivita sp. GX14005]|uniref:DUF3772 domain-containing protein n=1 Tax=Marivita sp. GX14005 TaxID=2942276 RepID=UPI0020186E08|nr:DUF3772 domain-containing protein [Marivita sp. GX14005]MCL3882489.1 DUF3772 domain-containing protein [Marivita sp. GX14005]
MTRLFHAIRYAALILALAASSVFAQIEPIDYGAWEAVAERAEAAVAEADASDEALEALRAEVSGYRDRLLKQVNTSDPRLATLQSQLDALGSVPEEGSEPDEIADRRAELERQIAEIRAPVKRAEEAYSRANGLIAEIDEIIRTRQADALLTRGPSPFDLRLWPAALAELAKPLIEGRDRVVENWQNPARRQELTDNLPLILGLVLGGLWLMLRAPHHIRKLIVWARAKTTRGTGFWSTLLSLVALVVRVAGLGLLAHALVLTDLPGMLGRQLAYLLPVILFVVLIARWLAAETFSEDFEESTLYLTADRRREARYYVNLLAWFLALDLFLVIMDDIAGWSEQTHPILSFPVHVLCGLVLFRLGQILRRSGIDDQDETEDEALHLTFPTRLARLAGQGAMLVGVAGPILSAIGYVNFADAIIFPTIQTLGLFGVMLILQRMVRSLYHILTGHELDDASSLLPVISGAVLTAISLPFLALIWGARVSDLTELWARFQAGFSFGDTRVSPGDFLTFIIVFMVGYIITRLLQGGLRGSVLPKTKIDRGGQVALVAGTGYLGIFLSAIIAITSAGIDLTALAVVAGALSVGIGFGLQNIVSNFVSGIILLIERPISEGDWIEVNGQHGTVRDISVRSTRIETFDRTDVIVPNADLVSNSVTNYTRGNVVGRLIVEVGVAYGSDSRKVEDILLKIARTHDMVLMNPAPYVHFKGFGHDALEFDLRMILYDVNAIMSVKTEINHRIYEAFREAGIELPFPQRDIWLRNPEALAAARADRADTPENEEEQGS